MTPVRLEPAALRSRVKHSTTEPLRSLFLKVLKKSYTAFTDILEWTKCNSDKATVSSVVCTVYKDGQPYKPCVLCETGFNEGQTCADQRGDRGSGVP